MNKIYKYLMLVFCFSTALSIQTQAQKISGSVVDKTNGETIPGVSIIVKGSSRGTVTDITGNYSIDLQPQDSVLIYSYIGFLSQEKQTTGQSTINVSLKRDVTSLDEYVVTGYTEKKMSLVTASISSIDPKEIETVGYAQAQDAIQGRASGVNITQESGSPGSGIKMRIRGTGSNGNSEPLYIVDGMQTSDINFLDPSEIASMEILKDAASSAIFGARGANGVVIVTTKAGESLEPGQTSVRYDFQYGVQSANNNLEVMGLDDYTTYMNEAGLVRPAGSATDLADTDWLDEIYGTAPQQKHTLSFSGASDKTNYYVQGSYFSQMGIIGSESSEYKRYSTRINLTSDIKDWLEVGVFLTYMNSQNQGFAENSEFGGVVGNAIMMDPGTPVSYQGSLPGFVQDDLNSGKPLLKDPNGYYYGLSNFVDGEIYNPVAGSYQNNGEGWVDNRLFASTFATIKFLKHFKATSRFGVDNNFSRYRVWNEAYYFTDTRQNPDAIARQENYNSNDWLWENYVTYDNHFGDNGISVLGGVSAQEGKAVGLGAVGTGLINESNEFGYISGTKPGNENTAAFGAPSVRKLYSYFGRFSYDFRNKYLFDVTVRNDNSSMLATGQQSGTFPAFSVGWLFTNEGFFPENDIVTFGKLRASWGQNGSLANLSPYQWASTIVTNHAYPDALGNLLVTAEPGILENQNLTWEKSQQTDIGIDLGLFQNHLTLTMDYFYKKTIGLLATAIVPDFVGNAAPQANIGDVVNKGFEIEAKYEKMLGEFTLGVSANATFLSNEVTALNGFTDEDVLPGAGVGTGWTATANQVGKPLWYFTGYQTDGVFHDQATLDNYLETYTGYTPELGDPIVNDVNGDGEISAEDQTYIGSPHPNMLLGFRIDLKYKGFDFTTFFQGSFGNDILMAFNRLDRATANKPQFFYDDRYTAENPEGTWFRAGNNSAYAYNSDFLVFDGSYLRMKQIQLGYTFPKQIVNKLKLGYLRVYVSGENLVTITDYPGIDPEVGSFFDNEIGVDRGTYSIPKRVLFGLSIKI